MTIPTKEEFDAWLSIAAAPVQITEPLPTPLTIDAATAFLRSADTDRKRAWLALRGMPAFTWLEQQREFQRAYGRVFPPPRRKSRSSPNAASDRHHERATRLFKHEEQLRSMRKWNRPESEWASDLRRRLERLASMAFDSGWTYRTMDAVAEYLGKRTAASFLDAAREIEGAARNAREAIARYSSLAEDVNRAQFFGVEVRPVNLSSRYFPTFEVPPITSPIGRKDARSDERLFVYRMFVTNRRAVRSPRIEAIAELMGLEGFRHQYDTRSIERLCARFYEWERRPARSPVAPEVASPPAQSVEKLRPSRRGNIALVRSA